MHWRIVRIGRTLSCPSATSSIPYFFKLKLASWIFLIPWISRNSPCWSYVHSNGKAEGHSGNPSRMPTSRQHRPAGIPTDVKKNEMSASQRFLHVFPTKLLCNSDNLSLTLMLATAFSPRNCSTSVSEPSLNLFHLISFLLWTMLPEGGKGMEVTPPCRAAREWMVIAGCMSFPWHHVLPICGT